MSSNSDNLKNLPSSSSGSNIAEKRPPIKTGIPNRYMAAIKQGPDLKKPKVKPAAVLKMPEVKSAPKVMVPVKVQPQQGSLTEEDKLDHLYNIYLQRTLLLGYIQEKQDFVNCAQDEISTVGVIDEYLTSEKNWFELLANEKVCNSISDLEKLEEVSQALDILHPFVTHKDTKELVQNMESSLSAALDVIPCNIPVQLPLDFSDLQNSVSNLDRIINSNNLFAMNLDMGTMRTEVIEDLNQTKENIEKKTTIRAKLATVSSLKTCDSYAPRKDTPSKENLTVLENPPIYQSTPFP